MHSGIRTRELASLIDVVSVCARVKGFRGRWGRGTGGWRMMQTKFNQVFCSIKPVTKLVDLGTQTKETTVRTTKGVVRATQLRKILRLAINIENAL